jgi:glycosyltransferase involved in cell wall biosynthesis
MGAGIPSIASGVGENRHVVRHGVSGFIADSAAEWCNAVKILAEDAARRENMGNEARRRASEYTYDSWFDIYEKLLLRSFGISSLQSRKQQG